VSRKGAPDEEKIFICRGEPFAYHPKMGRYTDLHNPKGTTLDANCYVLLWNLKCASVRQIAPGLSVRPLESKLTVFDLAAAGAVGFREWATLEIMASGCTSEIESAKDAAVTPGYDALNRAWLACSLLVLRGCGKVLPVAVSSYSWSIIAGFQSKGAESYRKQLKDSGVDEAVFSPRHQLPKFSGGLLDYRLKFLLCPSIANDELSIANAEWIHSNFDSFNSLAANSEKFRFALEAGVDWRYAHDQRAAIARLWAGIEALFGLSAELVYRISITAASLLKPRGESRVRCASQIKKLYGIRSKAVHGEQVSPDKMNEALDKSFVLLRDLLLLVASRGKDFEEEDLQNAIMG
jgi:hypothetical protein